MQVADDSEPEKLRSSPYPVAALIVGKNAALHERDLAGGANDRAR